MVISSIRKASVPRQAVGFLLALAVFLVPGAATAEDPTHLPAKEEAAVNEGLGNASEHGGIILISRIDMGEQRHMEISAYQNSKTNDS